MYISSDDVEYSEEAIVAAFRDYYTFLTKLYLRGSAITEPPVGGWPNINAESLRGLDKDKVVI